LPCLRFASRFDLRLHSEQTAVFLPAIAFAGLPHFLHSTSTACCIMQAFEQYLLPSISIRA
jgi:hypothetical protein